MRKKLLILGLALLHFAAFAGGEKFQINFHISPNGEWLWFSGSPSSSFYNSSFGTKLSYNVGLEYKRFFDPSLSLSIGALYMNKGFRNKDPFDPSQITLYSSHMAAVPISLNIHQDITRRTEMIYSLGIVPGYSFSERVRSSLYSGEDNPTEGLFDLADSKGNIDLLNDVYLGAALGIGISTYLKSRVVMVIQPTFKFQLNNAHDYLGIFIPGDPVAMRMNSFGVDFKIGYFFTKQVRNRTKDI